jgi:hypothetical protein
MSLSLLAKDQIKKSRALLALLGLRLRRGAQVALQRSPILRTSE